MFKKCCYFFPNYYSKVFSEKYNFNDDIGIYSYDSCNVDSDEEYSDDSDKKLPVKKIQMKKIKCINLFLEKTSDLISIHRQKPEIWEEIF